MAVMKLNPLVFCAAVVAGLGLLDAPAATAQTVQGPAPQARTADIGALKHPTMIVMGDYDIMGPEHAVELFRLRNGGAPALAAPGFLTAPPPARLLILPAMSHIGLMVEGATVVALVTPFLDDVTPRMPPGFF